MDLSIQGRLCFFLLCLDGMKWMKSVFELVPQLLYILAVLRHGGYVVREAL